MAEKVEIEISVTSVGAGELAKVDTSLASLARTTDKNTVAQKKSNTEMVSVNTGLTKQVPVLGQLNSLWSGFGISSLMTAGALGAAGIAMLKVVQTADSLHGGIAALGITLNTQTRGPMVTYSEMTANVTDLSRKWFVSTGDIQKAMLAMNPTITDQATRQNILNDALQLHRSTGISVTDAVKQLSGALSGSITIYDKNTGAILLGNDAYVQQQKNIMAMGSTYQMLKSWLVDLGKTMWEAFVKQMTGQTLLETIARLIDLVPKAWKVVSEKSIEVWKGFSAGFKEIWDKIDIVGWLVDFGKKAYATIIGPVFDWFKSGFQTIFSWISDAVSGLWDSTKNLWSAITGGNKSKEPSGAVMGSYASGTDYVPQTGPYILHRGEAVIPANQNTGGQTTINLIVDGQVFQQWFMEGFGDTVRLRGGY